MNALRSQRSKERVTYEAEKTIELLRKWAERCREAQLHKHANELDARAENLERAINNQKTGFDYAGGRGDWLLFNELAGDATT